MIVFDYVEPPAFTLPDLLHAHVPLRLSKDLVTVAQWNEFAQAECAPEKVKAGDLDLPVTRVSWHEADEYCKWFTEVYCDRRTTARLPYEYELCLAEQFEEVANRDWSSWPRKDLAAARWRGKRHNDITGVVLQWCLNGDSNGRVLRGGAWNYTSRYGRSPFSYFFSPAHRSRLYGFRLAFDVDKGGH